MSNEDHILELLPAYTLGALDMEEAEQVALHLSHCATCQAEWRTWQAMTDDLPLAIEQAERPARLRQQLMTRIEATEIPPQVSFWQQVTAVFRQHKAIFVIRPRISFALAQPLTLPSRLSEKWS